MGDYATRHHPDVTARKLAHGMPLLNSFRAEGWREKLLNDFGIVLPAKASKTELYIAWRKASLAKASNH